MEKFMLHRSWQLQDAKNRFSQVVNFAKKFGPQIVTKHGKEVVVVLSFSEYKKLTRPKSNLVKFFQNAPLAKDKIDLNRDHEQPRDIQL
jgi:prevent-host-death family protein